MLGYEETKSPTSWQEAVLLYSLLDLSWLWESLGKIYKEGLDVGWLTSIGYGGKVLVILKNKVKN